MRTRTSCRRRFRIHRTYELVRQWESVEKRWIWYCSRQNKIRCRSFALSSNSFFSWNKGGHLQTFWPSLTNWLTENPVRMAFVLGDLKCCKGDENVAVNLVNCLVDLESEKLTVKGRVILIWFSAFWISVSSLRMWIFRGSRTFVQK